MKLKATEVFEWNYNCGSEVIVNVGGARSSKSYSIAQVLLLKMLCEENKKILILRKTLPSLRLSSYRLMTDLMSLHHIYNSSNHNRTERIYKYKSNMVHFTGLDDPQKIKSTEWNYIWMEEANEFTWEDYITLKTRMSAKSTDGMRNKMYLSLNPCDEQSWVKNLEPFTPQPPKAGITVFKSSYKNNPFLPEDYINLLEDLKNQDETYYKIYTLGEWATAKGTIYNNRDTEYSDYKYDEVIYGLDFGFNNPTALVKIIFFDGELHISQLIYESGLTNNELIMKMKMVMNDNKNSSIYADAAEPQRIEEISRAGFNIHPANKSVLPGIDHLKSCRLHIDPCSPDILDEIKKYKWKEDRNGKSLDEPVKFNDHAMDAIRYAVYSHYLKYSGREIKMAIIK